MSADCDARAQSIAQARLRKAVRLAGCLCNFGCDAEAARALDGAGRNYAEQLAGVTLDSSDQTWELVALLLAEVGLLEGSVR